MSNYSLYEWLERKPLRSLAIIQCQATLLKEDGKMQQYLKKCAIDGVIFHVFYIYLHRCIGASFEFCCVTYKNEYSDMFNLSC